MGKPIVPGTFSKRRPELDRVLRLHQELHRFLLALRSILRASTASALVTLPASLSVSPAHGWLGTREEWVKSLAWNVDACVELRGFSGELLSLPVCPLTH